MDNKGQDSAGGVGNGSFWELLKTRNFRLLWGAGTLSAIGDQFDLIAFPWLVLLLTGDPLAVGAIIAVGSVPTVFFMLIGGSIVDRSSPRMILQVSNVVRVFLGSVLAALVLTGMLNLWLLYLFALAKGIADAFYYPAQAALLPRIVTDKQLRHANVITQTTTESSGFVGPMLAGALIAAFSGTNNVLPSLQRVTAAAQADTAGVGFAFAVVAGAFLISSLLLAFLQLSPEVQKSAEQDGKSRAAEDKDGGSIWTSIGEGFRFVRSDAAMFTLFLLIAAIELFVQGPVIVGIPVLANTRLPQGALAVGIIASAYAGGALLGAVLAGALPAPKRRLGHLLVITYVLSGILIMPFGFLTATWLAAALVVAIGVMGGYTNIMFTTWLQARTPQKVMGRVMSLLMIASIGLSPISNAVSGALIKLSLGWVFVGAGAMMALLSLAAGLRREIAEMKMA
ncbi:MAG: MFS transporter [Caldilineaceae bacterium]|nr:MFS transporter [Caldilineaceae bacterium]